MARNTKAGEIAYSLCGECYKKFPSGEALKEHVAECAAYARADARRKAVTFARESVTQ